MANGDDWIGVYESGQPRINRNLLFRIDPARGLIEIVRRRVRHMIDLRDYFASLTPIPTENEKRQD